MILIVYLARPWSVFVNVGWGDRSEDGTKVSVISGNLTFKMYDLMKKWYQVYCDQQAQRIGEKR